MNKWAKHAAGMTLTAVAIGIGGAATADTVHAGNHGRSTNSARQTVRTTPITPAVARKLGAFNHHVLKKARPYAHPMRLESRRTKRAIERTAAKPVPVKSVKVRMPRLTMPRHPATVRYTKPRQGLVAIPVTGMHSVRVSRQATPLARTESVARRSVSVSRHIQATKRRAL